MAGFVLEDARLTKRKEDEKNKQVKDIKHAFECGAITVPLFISEARRKYLENKGLVTFTSMTSHNEPVEVRYYNANSPDGKLFEFAIRKHTGNGRPPMATGPLWGVYFGKCTKPEQMHDANPTVVDGLTSVMAMTDPLMAKNAKRLGYRAAITGDYDLFAIYTEAKLYRPDVQDKRMVSNKELEENIKAKKYDTGEHRHLGNINYRITFVRDQLNNAIIQAGYTGGNMVHHSDECGRPFINDVDLPVIAFVPQEGSAYGLSSLGDMREFISTVVAPKYAPVFNPGWMNELVWGSNKRAESIKAALAANFKRRQAQGK